jgi:hypothetical protein
MSKPVCVISEHDFVASIADALQYVAVYHPPSFVARPRRRLYGRRLPGRARRHRADPHELENGCLWPPPDLPGRALSMCS